MAIAEDLEQEFAENVRRERSKHPKGWEPYVEEHGDGTATAVSQPIEEENPEHDDLIRGWNLDPSVWKIVGKVNVRRWQAQTNVKGPNGGEIVWLYYYKADLVRRDLTHTDLDALVASIIKRSARQRLAPTGTAALVVNWADWQVGKADGDGVAGVKQRLADMIGHVEDRWRDLKKIGVPLSGIYVNGLGDLGEACGGHYAQQSFRTALNVREQRKVIRWAADSALDSWARLAPWVSVKVVGGNHGEERMDGKSYTDFADNRDVAVFEDLAFAYQKNADRYGHVSFAIPNDDLTLTYEHEGTIVGLAHGHQAGYTSGGDPAKKIENWWRGQMAGQQDIGDADILVTGHYHHAWMRYIGKRTHFGCPALEDRSDWWKNTSGLGSPPGTLTFVLDSSGWSQMQILG